MNRPLYIILPRSKPFEVDCQLNDPNVLVELYRGKRSDNNLQKVDPQTDPLVTQNGQMFRVDVSNLTFGNNMEFECRAINNVGQVVLEKALTLEKARGLN